MTTGEEPRKASGTGDKYGGIPLIWPEAVRHHYNSLDDLTRRSLPQDPEKLREMMLDPNVRIFVALPPEDAETAGDRPGEEWR